MPSDAVPACATDTLTIMPIPELIDDQVVSFFFGFPAARIKGIYQKKSVT
ncbi:MAG: hypothetical protein QGH58_03465 [Arenicellales bacterium]|jgi:hypothetical protein|nr:hypothetical protein [Arenicellales bacterium]MDP6551539.1 hypothetical protein [Arenicellales bacterium]MDP6790947.1 hypothetical protein [Arenicellales bacterium]|tara:strand:- start:254 stop:403 length:150 start_codon:yes stop_codon:yes gene_type:complete